MLQAMKTARSGGPEDRRAHPKVGALVARGGSVVGLAHRGELAPGEHAEFTLLQRKLSAEDLRGTTLFTTLEPCTSRRHPKRPCVEWIIERDIGAVFVGMLDPDPRVYEQGVRRLRDAGISVDFFPKDLRDLVRADSEAFIGQFKASPDLTGKVSFNFTHNDGQFSLGHGELTFQTHWSNAGASSIHVYVGGTNLRALGLSQSARSFSDIKDASAYDMTSDHQTPREGQFVVLENNRGYYAVVRVLDVKARSHGDLCDALTVEYRINPDGSQRFTD